VTPRRFNGGSIGDLAVNGTVNDLAAMGAEPVAITVSLVLEEGLAVEELRAIVDDVARAAATVGVDIVTGDTKVVERGAADGCYITTTGIGFVRPDAQLDAAAVQPPDALVLSGTIGDHGVAVMVARGDLALAADVASDTAPLHQLVAALLDAVPHTRAIRFTGTSTNRQVQEAFDSGNIRSSNYQGPSGITLPISESLSARSISYTSLWGHVAHYLHATPNFRVSLGLARYLSDMLSMTVDLGNLYSMADAFDREVEKVIAEDEQLGKYILTLEQRYDAASDRRDTPDPADLVKELEQFLRAERGGGS